MRVDDLHHQELLELDPDGGVIRFAGQRALLLDAVAMGVLRQYLVENFGLTAARAVLTQFGFAHGWRTALAMKQQFKWKNPEDWRRVASRIYTLEGLFCAQPGFEDPSIGKGLVLQASYEAEQHLLHFGRSDAAVCWTISGLISGFASHISGQETYVLEDRCLAQGHGACHLVGQTRAEWGDERSDDLVFFKNGELKDCLEVSLSRVAETLKAAETRLNIFRYALSSDNNDLEEVPGIVTRSGIMRNVIELARRVAKVDAAVLITGESGVGKEHIARFILNESTRSNGPFISVNCSAIPEALLESELFGHKKGAFTGAVSDRPGLFEAASHGTLLLDEIGDITPAMQMKLLRVLQEKKIRRVGENQDRAVDVRVLAATNRDLTEMIAAGSFREDLYYRLKVVELHVPPLRERQEDILPLARLKLADAAERMGRSISRFAPAVADLLVRYSWPGNVRELENAMERAVALACSDCIEIEDLPEDIRTILPTPLPRQGGVQPLRDVEREYILASLELNGGNQTRTASQLNIGSATLYRKLKLYGVIGGTAEDAPTVGST